MKEKIKYKISDSSRGDFNMFDDKTVRRDAEKFSFKVKKKKVHRVTSKSSVYEPKFHSPIGLVSISFTLKTLFPNR